MSDLLAPAPGDVADPTTAAGIRDRLFGWRPPANFTHVYEVAHNQANMGNKIDVVILGLWKSSGLTVESVEVKVSKSDFASEINNPAKSEWAWQHSDRFWLAAPSGLAGKVLHDCPPTWGVLAVAGNGCRVLRPAPLNTAKEPLPWPAIVGMVRNASGAGAGALERAQRLGETMGFKRAQEQADRARSSRLPLDEIVPHEVNTWRRSHELLQEFAGVLGVERVEPVHVRPLVAIARVLQGRQIPDARPHVEWARRELEQAIGQLDRLLAAVDAVVPATPPTILPGAS